MKPILLGASALLVLALLPLATAQDARGPAPRPAGPDARQPPSASDAFLSRFDLNKDGGVTWEEYQKVSSGFAARDVDGDGTITKQDLLQAMDRMQGARMRHEGRGRHAGGGHGDAGGPGMQQRRRGPGGHGMRDRAMGPDGRRGPGGPGGPGRPDRKEGPGGPPGPGGPR